MKILELQLLSHHLDATAMFYSVTLGLPVIETSDEHIVFRAGSTSLAFHTTTAEKPFYHFAFNIVPSQFEACLHWARTNLDMIPVEGREDVADFSNWNARAFYFFDNNGNICECIARFGLEKEFPIAQELPAIISVSEIGCVVDDVKSYCERIIKDTEVGYFSRQEPREDFAAIGDDEGLLIVASDHRHWYPTTIPSEKWPLQLLLETAGTTKKIELETTKTA